MPADLDLVRRLVVADHGLAVVSIARPDGSVHTSLVNAGVLDHPVTGAAVIGLVARGAAAKVALVRRTPRAAVTFRAGWEWVAVEGSVELVGPDDPLAGVDPVALLRDVFAAAGGTHGDWDEYDRVMAAERRVAMLVLPARISSNG
jgi:PPOX class probable F420-dependent enzyme